LKSAIGNQRSAIARREAFTLLELLVVIGIIVVLVGILVPVASSMRRQARVSATQQLIAAIDAAISQYEVDQRNWPGPFESEIDRASNGTWNQIGTQTLTGPTGTLKPTRSEELLLCLAGGINVARSATPPFTVSGFTYSPDDIGRGHVGLGLKNQGRMKDLMATSSSRSDSAATAKHFVNDTPIPEFVDAFEGPVLYVRAKKGDQTVAAYNALINETTLYTGTSDYPANYVASDTLPGQTRQANRFLLISAGVDKKFGTVDDITNFGTPKMN
jgi:type II secretory pathway pseudopilin PulG